MSQPALLLDIDGVISLFGFDRHRQPQGRFLLVDGIPHFLSPHAADLATGLADTFELVWCSGWEDRADTFLPTALGMPRGLTHLSFGAADAPAPAAVPRHWKLAAIEAYAGPDRPLAWVDDAHDPTCHAWAAARRGPTRLVATDPAVGLTDSQAQDLRAWARALR
jgi:Swiss Army Knife RNA repair-like protein